MSRALDVIDHAARKDRLAQYVADGASVHEAGEQFMGLSKGQTARLWANIKRDLGWQAN